MGVRYLNSNIMNILDSMGLKYIIPVKDYNKIISTRNRSKMLHVHIWPQMPIHCGKL